MKKFTAHAPMNYQHKYLLVEAERARVAGDDLQAITYYEQAIKLAQENEYFHEEALANELAAKFLLNKGNLKTAQYYLQAAVQGYIYWGAKAKVAVLAKQYPQLSIETRIQTNLQTESTATIENVLGPNNNHNLKHFTLY